MPASVPTPPRVADTTPASVPPIPPANAPSITRAIPSEAPAPDQSAYSTGSHVRAALLLLVVAILLLGLAYPLALVGFGQLVNPHGANGSLNYNPNGTVNNSSVLPPGTNSTLGGPTVPLPAPSPAAAAAGSGGPATGGSLSYSVLGSYPGGPRVLPMDGIGLTIVARSTVVPPSLARGA